MATMWSTLDNTLQQAVMTLSMKVEVSYRSRYRFTKDDNDLIKLFMKSSYSQYPDVMEAWAKVSAALNTRQKTHFGKNGVNLGASEKPAATAHKMQSPRRSTKAIVESAPPKPDPSKAGKRKIVYRGQEKWVD